MLCLLSVALVSCSDVWDTHYDEDAQRLNADKTLWEEIKSRSDLNEFANMLELYGYDQLLDGDQMFTVFAPQGAINAEGLDDEKVKTEVLDNHIARFAYSANSSTVNKEVAMLNTKMVNFTATGTGYKFGNTALTGEYNIVAKNGVLHVITAQQPFFHNIWEYLTTDTIYDSIRTYLYSFNKEYLDENASVKGEIINGKQEYVDSVIVTSNEMFYRIGQLNNEDSTYSMIVPTNRAWKKAYERVSAYYNYPRNRVGRDSLRRHYTGLALASDLVFSHTVQKNPQEALISTYPSYRAEDLHVFEKPFENILYGYNDWNEGTVCSNGSVFVVDTLRHAPWQSWHSRMQIEGENTNSVTITNGLDYRRSMPFNDSLYSKISSGAYVEIAATNTTTQPSMVYKVWNTLAAKYDVKIVFLPQEYVIGRMPGTEVKGNSFKVSYAARSLDGVIPTTYTQLSTGVNNPYKLDTVSVGTITLPACAYGEESAGLELKIESNMKPSDVRKNKYSTTFLIDCIILEPSKK